MFGEPRRSGVRAQQCCEGVFRAADALRRARCALLRWGPTYGVSVWGSVCRGGVGWCKASGWVDDYSMPAACSVSRLGQGCVPNNVVNGCFVLLMGYVGHASLCFAGARPTGIRCGIRCGVRCGVRFVFPYGIFVQRGCPRTVGPDPRSEKMT